MTETTNFIHQIIDKDLETKKYGDKPVITRFPPEPNGYLHIGHAKSICLNFTTAAKYGGKCNLRYDDTNPEKEDMEYINSIEEDVRWLGFEWAERRWASDYFNIMYDSAVELIKKGKAYVCELTPEEIREYRGTLTEPGKNSPYRDRTVDENLRLFEEMKDGKHEEGSLVLRAKIDMASPNINMRDPVIYRIAHVTHHNTGDEWCIYPMYDFAHPIEDAVENITHSICTLEFEDHRPLYDWVLEEVGFWPMPPQQIEFARLNLTNTVMSKRYLKKLVDDGVVEGWDDPRMPTIAGIRRRGYTAEAVRNFCEEIGVAKANSTVDVALLEHCVRDDLKEKVESRNVIFDPVKVIITNYPEGMSEECEIENNVAVPEMGTRKVTFSREIWIDGADFMVVPEKKYFRLYPPQEEGTPGNEVRLKGAYFIRCTGYSADENGKVKEIYATYDPETKSGSGFEGRKVKGTIHFVDAANCVPITVRSFGYLMIEDPENPGEMISNPETMNICDCIAEKALAEAEPAERFQFFRHGYYNAEPKLFSKDNLIFNEIVGLKSSWK